MTASIFLRTYRTDRFWADYCLRSLAKFATGFLETVVCIPRHDAAHFEHTFFHGAKVVWVDEPDDDNGYRRQQITKLHADEYCSGDVIIFVDSDCFVKQPIAPGDFMSNGKPIHLLRHWADAGTALPWKSITEKFLGFEPLFEGMACLPQIIDRRVLPMLREHARHTHKKSLEEYVMAQPGNDFSEFNAHSAFAHRFTPYLYDFRIADPATDGFPRCLFQRWSYGKEGIGKYAAQYEEILASPASVR